MTSQRTRVKVNSIFGFHIDPKRSYVWCATSTYYPKNVCECVFWMPPRPTPHHAFEYIASTTSPHAALCTLPTPSLKYALHCAQDTCLGVPCILRPEQKGRFLVYGPLPAGAVAHLMGKKKVPAVNRSEIHQVFVTHETGINGR